MKIKNKHPVEQMRSSRKLFVVDIQKKMSEKNGKQKNNNNNKANSQRKGVSPILEEKEDIFLLAFESSMV